MQEHRQRHYLSETPLPLAPCLLFWGRHQVDFFSSQGGQQQTEQQPGRGEDDDTRADSAAASSNSSSKDSAKQARTATVVVDGQAKQFMVEYVMKFPTKGGHMVDTKLSFDHMDTMHR